MKGDDVLKMMGRIDPALIEEVELTERKKRRMSGVLRTGLIAACVCLALLGVVGAAATLNGVFQGGPVYEEFSGVMCDGQKLHVGGLESIPHEALREEFLEAVEENEIECLARPELGRVDIPLRYLDQEEAQEDMGIALAENEVLKGMLQGECDVHIGHEPSDWFWIRSRYVPKNMLDGMKVFVDVIVYTEAPSTIKWFEDSVDYFEALSIEDYVMPDGSTAVIQEWRYTDDTGLDWIPYGTRANSHYQSIFVQDGLLYIIEVVNVGDRLEEGRALLEEILDAFVQQ